MDSNNNSSSNPKLYSPSRSIPQHSGHGIMSPASNSSANHNNNNTNDSSTDGIHKLLAERMATGGGALCNDPNGLCLGYEGSIDASKSGIYTSIAKLAGMLSSSSSSSSSNSNNNSSSNNNAKKGNNEVPLVSIQTERASLLVKEYGGRTIVFRVPNADEEMMDSGVVEGGGNGEGDLMMSSNNAAAAATNSSIANAASRNVGDVGGDS